MTRVLSQAVLRFCCRGVIWQHCSMTARRRCREGELVGCLPNRSSAWARIDGRRRRHRQSTSRHHQVWRVGRRQNGEPRPMHACAARTKPLAGNRRATLRKPEAPKCAGTQPLAGSPRVTTLLRESSGPFLGARVLVRKQEFDSFVCWRYSSADY